MTGKSPLLTAILILWLVLGGAGPVCAQGTPPPASPGAQGQATPDTPQPMTDIHDIRPPVAVGFDAPWLMPVLLALAGAGIAAALLWWWRRRKRTPIETIVPELPPEMIAIRALDEIGDVRVQDGKAFYFRLSAILRVYISGRFGVGAPEMTTEEFLPCIDRLAVDRELARQLKQLCRTMDPVKFGGMPTLEKQMASDLFFARAFVRQTTPQAEPVGPPGDGTAPGALPPAKE